MTESNHDSPDRRSQYTRASNDELLRSLNEAWKTIRLNERAIAARDQQIHELHVQLERRDRMIERLERQLGYRTMKVWILVLMLGAQWSAIGWLANALLHAHGK
jgi:predicted RNase H-like nuclease (RuvC/YqgF family)